MDQSNSPEGIKNQYGYSVEELKRHSIFVSKGSASLHLIDEGSALFLLANIYGPGEGKILLTMAIYEAARRGGKILKLSAIAETGIISQDSLELFYKSFGFERCDIQDKRGYIHMQKDLSNLPLVPANILEKIFQTHGITPQTGIT